jgi:hypothetical protein
LLSPASRSGLPLHGSTQLRQVPLAQASFLRGAVESRSARSFLKTISSELPATPDKTDAGKDGIIGAHDDIEEMASKKPPNKQDSWLDSK